MPRASSFKSPAGKRAFNAAYDAAMELWPVPFEEVDLEGKFGSTHIVISGPEDAPPLILLHGFIATLTSWSPNVGDFAQNFRTYAIDVMGQPSKSVMNTPIKSADELCDWLAEVMGALNLTRVPLVGTSYGGWLSMHFATNYPERVEKLVLFSPPGLLPLVRRFMLSGMLMGMFPTRLTVNFMMRWLGLSPEIAGGAIGRVAEVMYLGIKYFRLSPETAKMLPVEIPDEQLSTIKAPTLLLFGKNEVIYNPVKAIERAERLIPDLQAELVPDSGHEMCISKWKYVDERALKFLQAG